MSIATALTALSEDITAARAAVTAKGGTVTEDGGSSQLATDIATIPSGGSSDEVTIPITAQYDKSNGFSISFRSATLPERFVLNVPYINSFSNCFGNISGYVYFTRGVKTLIIHGPQIPYVTSMTGMFGRCSESDGFWGKGSVLESITLDFDMSLVSTYEGFFYSDYRNKVREIIGTFDFSSCTSAASVNAFNVRLNSLTYLRYKPNMLKFSQRIGAGTSTSALSDESLISILNGLNETATGQTMTIPVNAVERCAEITGRSELDDSETYHLFVADQAGSLTLEDFVSTVKGWTLAAGA